MAPQLRQINVSYIDKEDRLLLRVSTSEDSEYRLWCTRRFTRLLLERFDSLFEQAVTVAVPAAVPQASEVRREVAQMQHDMAVSEEAFSQAYEAAPTEFPLGERGLLVTTLKYNKLNTGSIQLQLSDGADQGMTLSLSDAMQHQFYELFQRAAEKADWFGATAKADGPRGNAVVH